MPSPTVHTAVVWEDGTAILMARILGADGTAVDQSDVSTIDLEVFDLNSSTPKIAVRSESLTVSVVIFNTLVTSDARWTVDTTGYNFLYTAPASDFVDGNRNYRFKFRVVATTGEVGFVVYDLTTKDVEEILPSD